MTLNSYVASTVSLLSRFILLAPLCGGMQLWVFLLVILEQSLDHHCSKQIPVITSKSCLGDREYE